MKLRASPNSHVPCPALQYGYENILQNKKKKKKNVTDLRPYVICHMPSDVFQRQVIN